MAKRIGILTAGTAVPGLNVCLKALVYNADDLGFEVVGIRKGWDGLLRYDPHSPSTHAENAMVMTKSRVRDIDRMAGSFLHFSRTNPAHISPKILPAFLQSKYPGEAAVDVTEHVELVLEHMGLDVLITMGGDATMGYTAHLHDRGVPVLAIPATVHNDVTGSDYSLGFSTALARGVQFIHEVRAMAGSREQVAVVEVLGRGSGLTTMVIALLAGADRVLIPEVCFDPEKLSEMLLQDRRLNPNNYAILTMSEGACIEPEKATKYSPELSRQAQSALLAQVTAVKAREAAAEEEAPYTLDGVTEMGTEIGGTGAMVTEVLENVTGQRLLFQPLSHLIRTGAPDGQDLLGAMNFAMITTRLLEKGKTGRLAAYRHHDNYVDLPIETVTSTGGNIDVAAHYDAATFYPRPEILWAARV